jgi:hypothetical protein
VLATSVIFEKLREESCRPIGENSPNLVTQIHTYVAGLIFFELWLLTYAHTYIAICFNFFSGQAPTFFRRNVQGTDKILSL